MAAIENLAALPANEQKNFAEALLKTINSEKLFHNDVTFDLRGIEADDMTGGLYLDISHSDPIDVPFEATWECTHADDAYEVPEYPTENESFIEKAFKTFSTVVEGYKVTLDVIEFDKIAKLPPEVEVKNISNEDSGIGSYDFGGHWEHDSHPYIEVTGILTYACNCNLGFFVEPEDNLDIAPEED